MEFNFKILARITAVPIEWRKILILVRVTLHRCELSGGELGSTTQLKRPDALQTEVGTMGCEASVRQVAIKAI